MDSGMEELDKRFDLGKAMFKRRYMDQVKWKSIVPGLAQRN